MTPPEVRSLGEEGANNVCCERKKEGSDEGKETQVEKQVRRCAHGEVMDAPSKPRSAMGNCNMDLRIKSKKVTLDRRQPVKEFKWTN